MILGILTAIAVISLIQIGAEYYIAEHIRIFDVSVCILAILALTLGLG